MAVSDIHVTGIWAGGGYTGSVEVTFPPTTVRAMAFMRWMQIYDDIVGATVGIRGYRRRPVADGAEETKSYGSNILDWPGAVHVTKCTSVTYGVWASEDCSVKGVCTAYKMS